MVVRFGPVYEIMDRVKHDVFRAIAHNPSTLWISPPARRSRGGMRIAEVSLCRQRFGTELIPDTQTNAHTTLRVRR